MNYFLQFNKNILYFVFSLLLCFSAFSYEVEYSTLANNSVFNTNSFRQIIELSEKIDVILNAYEDSEKGYQELNSIFYTTLNNNFSDNVCLIYSKHPENKVFFLVNFDTSQVFNFYKTKSHFIKERAKEHENINGLNIDLFDLSEDLLNQIILLDDIIIINPENIQTVSDINTRTDNSKLLNNSTEEYFFSENLNLFIQRKPLKITDSGVKEAANSLGIRLWWDDEGYIGMISYYDSMRLFNKLGIKLMSPLDYWTVLKDAFIANDISFIRELLSKRYAEWLNVLFFKENEKYYMIEHPCINEKGLWDREKDKSGILEVTPPEGRHAWFHFPALNEVFEIIDTKTGFPKKEKVEEERGSGIYTFKYWDIYTSLIEKMNLTAIRGRVTSSDSPSIDCGMPPDVNNAKKIMLRPCRTELLSPPIDASLFQIIKEFIFQYDTAMKNGKYSEFYEKNKDKILELIKSLNRELTGKFKVSQENSYIKIREKYSDILGFLKVYAIANDSDSLKSIDDVSKHFFKIDSNTAEFTDFKEFIKSSRNRLESALDPAHPKPIVFVMGHRNPDTDTVISSSFEAYRNYILNPDITYIPVVQNPTLPDEVGYLFDDKELSDSILLTDKEGDKEIYEAAHNSGQANWILVDHNESAFQKFVISILDHHKVSETALNQDVAQTIEIIGSTTGMVIQRFYGMGMQFDKKMAEIAYEATLMDTENRTPKKTTLKDSYVMNIVQSIANIVDEVTEESKIFFQKLMSVLLNTNNPYNLFNRDYKEDGGFGFAVAKMKNVFSDIGEPYPEKLEVLNRMVELAKENNRQKNFPLTLIKVADYEEDNETVRKERMYFQFSKDVSENFKNTIMNLFEVILQKEFKGLPLEIQRAESYVEWSGAGMQLSRKKVAPVLEPVVKAFNEYFYSDAINKYVRRDFLKITDKGVLQAAKQLNIQLSSDENGNVNNLTPVDLIRLVKELEGSILTPSGYLAILLEAKEKNDLQIQTNLTSHEFTEILNIVVLEYDKYLETGICIINPEARITENGEAEFFGKRVKLKIPFSEPGLIDWQKVSPETGIPVEVLKPGEKVDGDKVLSRYWSPNPDKACVFARGSIFIYQIPCMDGKVKINEKQPSIGVRLIRSEISPAKVNYRILGDSIVVEVDSDSGKRIYVDGVKLPIKDITEEINMELIDVDFSKHSLNLDSYTKNMFPERVLDAIGKGNIGEIQIHYGPLKEVKKKNPLLLKTYEDMSLIDPDDCKIGWYVKENENGKLDVIITDIRGKSKLKHQLYVLKYFGINNYTVISYEFDFVNFAKKKLFEGMKGRYPYSFNVGKSILGRKILRKSVYAAIFLKLKSDMIQSGEQNIQKYLTAMINNAANNIDIKNDLKSFFNDEHVKTTMQRMQVILDENPSKDDLVTYWQAYGDAVEDYVRLIRTINTGFLDSTKFAKRLEASEGINDIIFTYNGMVSFQSNGNKYNVNLSEFIEFKENPKSMNPQVGFKNDITEKDLINNKILKENPGLQNALINIYRFVNLFSGKIIKLPNIENLNEIEYLDEKFYEDNVDKDVFDISILRRPKNSELNETVFEPVGRYPFGSLSADFAEAAVESGAKFYFHVGSCGAFFEENDVSKWNLKKGDIILPYEVYNKQGKFLGTVDTKKMLGSIKSVLNKSGFPYRILKYENDGNLVFVDGIESVAKAPVNLINIVLTKHTSVDTPLEEDETLVKEYKRLGIRSVDCESAKVVERVQELGKPLQYEFMFWMADLPSQPGEDLSTEKDGQTINEATYFRKVKGILADIYTHLRFQEDREGKIFLPANIRKVSKLEETPLIDDINKEPDSNFALLLIGATSAGKTTFIKKCEAMIKGRKIKGFELDRYFKTKAEQQKDENGVLQFDIPEALRWEWIEEDLKKLLNSEEIDMPYYDFANDTFERHSGTKLKLEKGDVFLIDSIHARNPIILNAIKNIRHASVYLDCPRIIRLLRRIRRDIQSRGTSVEFTLQLWPGIEKAEDKFILPNKNVSDYVFSTMGDDELLALRPSLLPILYQALEIVRDKKIKEDIFNLINILDANFLYKQIVMQNNIGTMFLKGGNDGGLNPEIKPLILKKLDELGFNVIEGPIHKISFKEKLKRWGKGYFYWHFLKKIIDNKKLSNSFVNELKRCMENGDEEGFNKWVQEAMKIAKDDTQLKNALLVYDYYSSDGQYLFITPKPGLTIDTEGLSFQKFVKRKIVGETVCYNSKKNELRRIIADELKIGGKLRAIMEKSLEIEKEDEVFLSSKFNAIHCPDFDGISDEDEFLNEFFCMNNEDISILINLLNKRIIKLETQIKYQQKPLTDNFSLIEDINKAA
ncbi:MAG: hypothetical protein ACD_79C00157G0002 [uncultured bacterium]|nr:MAG: hypothetical protein ACD_79C00157G0002 [uncultured bacterium]